MKKENDVKVEEVKNEVAKPTKFEVVDPFEDFFGVWDMPTFFRPMWSTFDRKLKALDSKLPKTNLVEKDDHYELDLEVPGFEKEDIDVIVDNNIVTVVAKHEESKDEEGTHVLRERNSSYLTRSFSFPNVKKEDVKAKLNNGVLSVTIKKNEEEKKVEKVEIE